MNTINIKKQWDVVVNKILSYDDIDIPQAKAFLSETYPQAMSEDGFLMLTVESDFLKKWILNHYVSSIHKALSELFNKDFTIMIEVSPGASHTNNNQHNSQTLQVEQNPDINVSQTDEKVKPNVDISDNKIDPIIEASDNQIISSSENKSDNREETPVQENNDYSKISLPSSLLTFNNFVVGESNNMAYQMALFVAEEPGREILNPLFLYGKSGLGKTHLMRAIQNYINETQKNLKTIYFDSSDFLNRYVEASLAHDKNKTSFKKFNEQFYNADVFLIDDIQFLQGKEGTLDVVFQIFNHMVNEGKQVVLSADRSPKHLSVDERYQSRFNSGGTFDIQPPTIETKIGIIKSFLIECKSSLNRENIEIPDEVIKHIAEISGSNIRELKSAITKVVYMVEDFSDTKYALDKTTRLLEDHFSGGSMKKLTIEDIQKQIEEYYKISHTDLIGSKRSRNIMYPRKIAIYLSREMLNLPFNHIGKQFGNRDHSTIMHSFNNVEEMINSSRETREEIEILKKKIRDN